jgi:hypothetical protein
VDHFYESAFVLSTDGFRPGGAQQRARADEKERRAERAEMIAIAISLVLIIGALAGVIGAVLLSRAPPP